MGQYSNKREKKVIEAYTVPRSETNFIRPRYIPDRDEAGMAMKATITDKALCWGIVDAKDNFVIPNQQLAYNPWNGALLPLTTDALKRMCRMGR